MLTKTNFMTYLECSFGLWLTKNRPELIPEDTLEVKRIMAMGREVDDYSRRLFDGGIEVRGYNHVGWQNTQKFMKSDAEILFQPTAVSDEITCRADILERNGGGWVINEVKAATSVKKEYPYDVAFQQICFESAGVKIEGANLIHINNKYVRASDIEPQKLFTKFNITDAVSEKIPEVRKMIPMALAVLRRREDPDAEFLALCTSPKTCIYMKYYLESLGEKVSQSNFEQTIDRAGIEEKLAELKYPLYFLDYETYSSAIPPFEGTRPYQNIPFQYSLFIKALPKSAIKHTEFLAHEFKNPVPEFLASLQRSIGHEGSVIVWNMSFEKGCNDEMGRMEPSYTKFLKNLNERIFDLMIIFKIKNQLYVRNEFQGSASLKKVLPVMCPELSYDSLAIRGGTEALASWPVLTNTETSEDERKKLADDMLAYCKRDTEAMVCILDKLNQL